MPDIGGIVDPLRERVNRIQVFRVGCPTPRNAGFHCFRGNIFCPFKITHHQQFVLLCTRGERKTAIPHHHTGDAVPARTRPQRVPEHLGIHMGVRIDKPWGDHMPLGINDLVRTFTNAADGRDFSLADADVGLKARQS